jgi:hypothetical protein
MAAPSWRLITKTFRASPTKHYRGAGGDRFRLSAMLRQSVLASISTQYIERDSNHSFFGRVGLALIWVLLVLPFVLILVPLGKKSLDLKESEAIGIRISMRTLRCPSNPNGGNRPFS